ncbi:MAG TPA: beta-ketoacyl-ACP synthase III [Planctomycetaceae bacterium]|nr:beta-ketoacyl-ACP synthase III [Planctomycetaceae bacterium]HIQ20610.1 beta-ketoacyl-ACP synthase III [Planctomycetota bacterium]
MERDRLKIPLYLPAQGAAESEATVVEWYVSEGDSFTRGQPLGQIDSAKSVFDFEAPCDGRVVRMLCAAGDTVSYDQPVMEIETSDQRMGQWIPPAAETARTMPMPAPAESQRGASEAGRTVILGVGGYLPSRVVTTSQLVAAFPNLSADYVFQVTGVRQRRWAEEHERPSDMAYQASLQALAKAGLACDDIDALILATTTPDVAMPSTACILQERLGLKNVPAFDLNAACSGWLYAIAVGRSMVLAGMARTVLTVGVDVQSRLLDRSDQITCFLFGDGAGAAVVGAGEHGHRICQVILGSDPRGIDMARRDEPGYFVSNGQSGRDPWIRLNGQSLFRFAAESFAALVSDALTRTGWSAEQTRWVIPHQANARILKAAAKRCGVPFDRFYLNLDRVGNTSSASIPLALVEVESQLKRGDKLILCSVGAGVTTAAVAVEW